MDHDQRRHRQEPQTQPRRRPAPKRPLPPQALNPSQSSLRNPEPRRLQTRGNSALHLLQARNPVPRLLRRRGRQHPPPPQDRRARLRKDGAARLRRLGRVPRRGQGRLRTAPQRRIAQGRRVCRCRGPDRVPVPRSLREGRGQGVHQRRQWRHGDVWDPDREGVGVSGHYHVLRPERRAVQKPGRRRRDRLSVGGPCGGAKARREAV